MTTKRVTLDDALDALRKAVAEKGEEYQYAQHHAECRYATVVDGEAQPACIVGHALVYLGVAAENLTGTWLDFAALPSVLGSLRELGYELDVDAVDAFHAAQRVQDGSFTASLPTTTWGAALAKAEFFADSSGGAQ